MIMSLSLAISTGPRSFVAATVALGLCPQPVLPAFSPPDPLRLPGDLPLTNDQPTALASWEYCPRQAKSDRPPLLFL
jgi:hypothetical protein